MLLRQQNYQFLLSIALLALFSLSAAAIELTTTIDDEGTIHTPNGILPISRLLSPEAQEAMRKNLVESSSNGLLAAYGKCGLTKAQDWGDPAKLLSARKCFLKLGNYPAKVAKLKKLHAVNVEATKINGIDVDVVTPQAGIAPRNKNRVLFYIHGSGKFLDHPSLRQLGSIPAAAAGNIKVLGIDHRLSPEGKMAESMADLAAAYKGVLKEYPAENIGIFGCSAGGIFTATMVPYLHKMGLPLPGALSIQGENASLIDLGDSIYTIAAYGGVPRYERWAKGEDKKWLSTVYHTSDLDINDPVAEPTRHDETMKLFPPTIWMSSLRDEPVSRVVADHRALLRNGVETELHLWEGLPHCFPSKFPEIPETRDWWQQMNTFFDKHLGTAPKIR